VSKLTNDYKYYQKSAVKAKKEIVVLSQYRAQVSALKTELEKQGLQQCTVSTVVASQGQLNRFFLVAYFRSPVFLIVLLR